MPARRKKLETPVDSLAPYIRSACAKKIYLLGYRVILLDVALIKSPCLLLL
jgi:hypothetical protein